MTTLTYYRYRGWPRHTCGGMVITRPHEDLSADPEGWPLRFWCNHCRSFVFRQSCSQATGMRWRVS